VWVYAFMRCLKPLRGLNVRTFRAVISMLSPVCGFRPRRDALRRIRKWPKPTIFTSSPFSKQRKMMSNTDSTTADDGRFANPWLATAFTRSFFVTGGSHPLPRASLLWRRARHEPLVALARQLASRRQRGGAIRVRTHTYAVQSVRRRRHGRRPRRGRLRH